MRVLITGGAGFIGSRLADAMRADRHVVVVLDDLTTGFREHVAPDVELVEGSVADMDVVRRVVRRTDIVLHHAAARAVARSVEDPVSTDRANTGGTLNVPRGRSRRRCGAGGAGVVVQRVRGSGASTDAGGGGADAEESVRRLEGGGGAVCASVLELSELETVRLRYFNVFGPRQRPDSPYAAVIPLFVQAILDRWQPGIHGDGL